MSAPAVRVAAAILAAGASRRLGRPKQLVGHKGVTLLGRAVRAAVRSRCDPVLVVVGRNADRFAGVFERDRVVVVPNPGWTEGIAASIRAAVAALESSSVRADGLLLMPCDQPRISTEVLDRLVEAFGGAAGGLVASGYAGIVGAPAIFGRRWFGDLAALRGDLGARTILRSHRDRVTVLPWPEGEVDVDTPEDLRRLDG